MDIKIKGKHEDDIYPIREFIARLQKIQEAEFDKLYDSLIEDGFDPELKDYLFDYVFNSDPEIELVTLEEYCDHEYMLEFHKKQNDV